MADNTVSQLAPIVNETGLKFIENNGQILFSAEEIGRQLGYSKPAKSVNILYNRNQRELDSYARGINLMSCDGKPREVRHFTEEGVYILSMLANTPRAAEFRARLAKLLREIRERRVELAFEYGRKLGLDEARALPAAEADRKQAYLDGMTEGRKLSEKRDGLRLLLKARGYLDKGLKKAEAAKLCGISRQYLNRLIGRSRKVGL